MAMATGQPPAKEVGLTPVIAERTKASYADTLIAPITQHQTIPMKPLTNLHGEPKIVWEEEEIQQMIINEKLQYAVMGKFLYGWPDIQELRKLIPKQCDLKGESYPMRTLKWDPLFDPEEETTTTIAWISFPSLPPNLFGKETIFSMAAAVGRPLQVDMATQNRTRPSCARAKVEVDLLGDFPKRINIGMRKKSGKVVEKWVNYIHKKKMRREQEQKGETNHQGERKGEIINTIEDNAKEKKEKGKKSEEIEFKELRGKSGYRKGNYNQRRKPEQVWNQKTHRERNTHVDTKNQFGALEENMEVTQEHNKEQEHKNSKVAYIQLESGSSKTMQRRGTSTGLQQTSANDSSEIPATNISGNIDLWRQECEEVISKTQNKETNTGATEKDTVGGVTKATSTKEKVENLKLDKLSTQELQEKGDTEEEDTFEANINQISREGDLSPRQIEMLKEKLGVNRYNKPDLSYVNTKSRKKPFQSPAELDNYRRKLGKQYARVNYSSKIWVFWDEEWEEQEYTDTMQQLTCSFKHKYTHSLFKITAMYARCSALDRLELWEDLELMANNTDCPWLVGGDFNTIMDESEKLGGLPVTQSEVEDFVQCMNVCALREIKFSESEVHHLIRDGSDHAPLHVTCNTTQEQGDVITSTQKIGEEAVHVFKEQFMENNNPTDFSMLDIIPKLISDEQNEEMGRLPTEEEVKEVVFAMNGDSASGPDELPRFITHTNMILIPKKEVVDNFGDLRPISLSTFTNKIISRMLHERLVAMLPRIISQNQAGFVKGRSITENAFLAQEIVRDINRRNKLTNVVVKLDMEKAYDRVSWIFLSKSTRELKQGDPLSPTLFIIAAEVLARNLNQLFKDHNFKGFGLPKWSPKINHLSYADYTILFCSGHSNSMKKMMNVLRGYEMVSGQMINLDKSLFYLHEKVPVGTWRQIRKITGIKQGFFPFTYLGCPIFYGRRNRSHFEALIKKVLRRISLWQNRLLSFGSSYVLISHVLQSMPIYVLSAMNPPTCVINQLHRIFAKFFWANTVGSKNKHWVAWDKMCYPKTEGGLGWRSLHDVSKALFAKLWWNFRTATNSLWATYMWNKYCKKHHPIFAQGFSTSHVWRKMTAIREEVEHEIWWQVKAGTSSFWFDNWTKQGALYHIEENAREEEVEVKDFSTTEGWNREKILQNLSTELTDYIMENIAPQNIQSSNDVAWWMTNSQGSFTVKSAWELMRAKHDQRKDYELIWNKGLPFKINFFLWRVWKRGIATDDNLKRMKINIVSRCWCCDRKEEETITHLFLTAPIATKLWRFFANYAGINIEGMHLQQLINAWWK
ncbi:hypothetical protein KY289_009591 [Solanum tuberosum]|nr:hypothetical protein KY289_009591 [Solanum tuberosum]